MSVGPIGAKYQEVVWNKLVARDENGAPDKDKNWLAKLVYNDPQQPKAVCSRSEDEIADIVSKSIDSIKAKY